MKTNKTTITGAEAILKCLMLEYVDTVFGYPGGAIMPVYDALYDYGNRINHILCRHEQGAVHAAQGYARATGKVGVCLATSGPGATNLITGIADAHIDSTPLVCITGQVADHLLGTDAFQETAIVDISTPVTKWNVQVTRAEEIPGALAKAFYVARTGRPGPVLVDITKNAQFGELEFEYTPCTWLRSYAPEPDVDVEAVEKAAGLINHAQRPYVLFGQGVLLANASREFRAFIEKAGIPAAWTIMGLSALPADHPLNMGMLGMHGNYGPNLLTNECDVLIAVGMRFDDRVTGDVGRYAKQARIIHLEIDPAEVDKVVQTDVALLGNCKKTLPLLTSKIHHATHSDWIRRFSDCASREYREVIAKELRPQAGKLISMGEVIHLLSEKTGGEALLVTDVGQHQMVAQRYYRFKEWNSNITSGGLGTMGFALPAAMGAKLGQPDRLVVAVIGDGGFQMTVQELGTIFQSEVNLKILILNNGFLGMVRQWQELFFDRRYASTEMVNPDFQTIAAAYGIWAERVKERDALQGAMQRFLNQKESSLLEVCVGKENNVFPMVPAGASVSDIRLK